MENNWIETSQQLPTEPGQYITALYGNFDYPLLMSFTLTPTPKFIHHFEGKNVRWFEPHSSIYKCLVKPPRKCKVSHWKKTHE